MRETSMPPFARWSISTSCAMDAMCVHPAESARVFRTGSTWTYRLERACEQEHEQGDARDPRQNHDDPGAEQGERADRLGRRAVPSGRESHRRTPAAGRRRRKASSRLVTPSLRISPERCLRTVTEEM